MAMYKYNGVRLRGTPSWNTGLYPNAIIYYVANESGVEEAHFGYSDQPFYLDTTQNLVTNTEGATIYASIYNAETRTWGEIYLFYDAAFALEPDKVLWSNVDVLDDTGAVFLASSEPIKLFLRRAWTNLLLAGLCSRPLPLSKREPVAYLYNGVRLPALPEWDREMYPYAVITGKTDFASLFVSDTPMEAISMVGTGNVVIISGSTYGRFYADTTSENEGKYWSVGGEFSTVNSDYFCNTLIPFVWSNFDLYDRVSDSTILTATDPIPVYE